MIILKFVQSKRTQDPGVLGISFKMFGITKPMGGFLV